MMSEEGVGPVTLRLIDFVHVFTNSYGGEGHVAGHPMWMGWTGESPALLAHVVGPWPRGSVPADHTGRQATASWVATRHTEFGLRTGEQ
jgi:hypothetical protein